MSKRVNFDKHINGINHDYQFYNSADQNAIALQYYMTRLSELAMSTFYWNNCPDTVDVRFLEYTLYNDGVAVFFEDNDLKYDEHTSYLTLQVMLGSNLDVYRTPKYRRAYASNGYTYKLNEKNSVLIWNNMLRIPEYGRMLYYANKLAIIDRIIDVNVNAQKTPVVILCDEKQRLTMKNLYLQYDGNQPFIFGSKDLELYNIKTLDTKAPFIADKLQQLKDNIWAEAMACLGIPNSSGEKKERLVSHEATLSQGGTIASRSSRLLMRKNACKEINKMFGLNLSVEYNPELKNNEGGDQENE